MPLSRENPKVLQKAFIAEVSLLLLPNNAKGTALLKFLRHYMNKWHIRGKDPYDILLDGISRGLQFIEQTGNPILKAEAWLRSTCLNILKDAVKESIKDEALKKSILLDAIDRGQINNPLTGAELLEQLELLQIALKRLPSADRDILQLRFCHEKTYSQIQKYYESLDGQIIQEAALRKRESRALRRLRKRFLKLYEEGVNTMP